MWLLQPQIKLPVFFTCRRADLIRSTALCVGGHSYWNASQPLYWASDSRRHMDSCVILISDVQTQLEWCRFSVLQSSSPNLCQIALPTKQCCTNFRKPWHKSRSTYFIKVGYWLLDWYNFFCLRATTWIWEPGSNFEVYQSWGLVFRTQCTF